MLKKILFVLFIISIVAFLVFSCNLFKKREKFIVASPPDTPPLTMINEKHKLVGFEIDLIKEIAEEEKLNIKIIPVLRENLIYGLIDEIYDIAIGGLKENDREISENRNIQTSIPYLTINEVLVLSEENRGISSLDQLSGKAIGLMVGSRVKEKFQNIKGIKLVEYKSSKRGFEDIIKGKIDGFCTDLIEATQMAYYNPEYENLLWIFPEPLTRTNYIMAVKKGNLKAIRPLNSGIEKLKKNGKLEELINTWFFREGKH